MMMLFLLQFMLIFHGAYSIEENEEDSVKNETAVGTDSLQSRSDAFKPSYLYEYGSTKDGSSDTKPIEEFQHSDWSSSQYKFQDSDSYSSSVASNPDQKKDFETTIPPYNTYQEPKWSKPLTDAQYYTNYEKSLEYEKDSPSTNEQYYQKPFSYEDSKPPTDDKYYDKPFSYEESRPPTDDHYYEKTFSYEESKQLTNQQYYEKPFSYEDGKPLTDDQYYKNPFSYEDSKPPTDDQYYAKPFSYEDSKPPTVDQYYEKPFSYEDSKPTDDQYYDKPFSYENSKPPTDDHYYEKPFSYENSKPLTNDQYYEKPFSYGDNYEKPYSYGSNYQTIQSSKLLEFNKNIPSIKPFVMENSYREYIPLKMVEDYSQKDDPSKLAGTHVSIPAFKTIKSGKIENFGKKPMYAPIVIEGNQNQHSILEATKNSIQTLQQSIKDNTPFALPFTYNQDNQVKSSAKDVKDNAYYFKFEDKRPNNPLNPKLQTSYNFKLFDDKHLPLVKPTNVYHGPRYTIPTESETFDTEGHEYNSNEGHKPHEHYSNSFSKPTKNFKFTDDHNQNPIKIHYQNVVHKPVIEHHVKVPKQLRKKIKKRPVVYWDDDKKHLINHIPTPFEEPVTKTKMPPKGPYIQRIPDPHNRFKDQYILPDSTSNIGKYAQQQQSVASEPSFFENLTNMLFGEYPSNNDVVYVPVKPKRLKGGGKPRPHPNLKRAQPRNFETEQSEYRIAGHVNYFKFK